MTQKLTFSKDTIAVLKNFNTINPNILFKEGHVITTISSGKTILAKYEADEDFNSSFGIYKLDKLLSVLSFFNEPEVVIDSKSLSIKSNGQTAKIAFADPSVLVYPQKDDIELPSVDAEFDISENDINTITKAVAVMELPYVEFHGDGKHLFLRALDFKNPSGDAYSIEIGKSNKKFSAIFNISNLKLIPADYKVEVSAKGISKFSNEKMTYYVAVEKDSVF